MPGVFLLPWLGQEGSNGNSWVEGKDAAKHLTKYCVVPTIKKCLVHDVHSISVEKLCSRLKLNI